MKLRLTPRTAARFFALVIALLTLLSISGQACRYLIDRGQVRCWVAAVDLNREQNLPTYYQAISIFAAAVLLAVICLRQWQQRGAYRIWWTGLCGLVLLLSFDEMACLHEQMNDLMARRGIELGGYFAYQWVIPAMAAVVVVGLIYARFVWQLPRHVRSMVILSGLMYVVGAIGIEMIGAKYMQHHGDNNLIWQLINNFEEVMEMTGIALLNVALLKYMSLHAPIITLQIDADTAEVGELSEAAVGRGYGAVQSSACP